MPQMVFVAVITLRTEIVIGAFRAFPSEAENGLHSASVAHRSLVFDGSDGAVQNAKVVSSSAAIIGWI